VRIHHSTLDNVSPTALQHTAGELKGNVFAFSTDRQLAIG
jgi:hypothetical protein